MPRTSFTPSGGVTAASRRASQKAGHTMPGGSFPINNKADLGRAKHDVGRASNPAAARSFINKRAKQLGAPPIRASGHRPQTTTPIATDRGSFKVKG